MDAPLSHSGFNVKWRVEAHAAAIDRTRVRQALLALLENVRVHARPGPVEVSLRSEASCIVIAVADSGPGLPSDLEDILFEPFQRGPTTASGFGVGLAVVRYVAEGHGGTARVQRSPFGGSEFQIRLPLML